MPTEVRLFGGGTEVVREDLLSLVGVLFDVAERPVPGQNLTVWMNGQFLTNVTTDAEGSFSILYPVPLDMDLGTQTVEVRFAGAPSTSHRRVHYFRYSPDSSHRRCD